MADHIRIRDAQGTWVVRAGGAVIGESDRALELTEGDLPMVIYFPREDLAMAFLEPTGQQRTTPEIGEAKYFAIHTKSTVLRDAAWTYEDPEPGMEAIKGHVAFYATDQVAVEAL